MTMNALRLSRLISSRALYPRPRWYSQTFTPSSEARDKLRAILEEYRIANYQQTIPSRFVKDIVKAADENGDGFLERDEAERFLANIGAGDKLTSADLTEIMTEVFGGDGGDVDKIPIDRVQEALLSYFEKKA